MNRAIDNGKLLNDLDGAFFVIRNIGTVSPVPDSLVGVTDSRLTDARPPLDGSVVDASVDDSAGIVQSKLNLNGDIPPSFLGLGGGAKGSLVQRLSEKGVAGGYVSLGVSGKMPTGSTPVTGTGTLKEVVIELPVLEMTTVPGETGTTRLITGYWSAQQAETFFGNMSGGIASPLFEEERTFNVDLIPDIDASKITSGTFSTDQVPSAVGVGTGHAPGIAPHPGSSVTAPTAQPDDYLARDMTYRAMKPLVSYQPQLSAPSISVQSYYKGQSAYINITQWTGGTNLFYAVGSNAFTEALALPILVPVGQTIQAYAAKIGYNNSEITVFTVPPSPTT